MQRLPQLRGASDHGYVYVVKRDNAYKVGFTRHGLARRMRDAGGDLVLTIKVDQRPSVLEYLINKRFADKRLPGFLPNAGGKREWFALTPDDLEWLKGLSTFLQS